MLVETPWRSEGRDRGGGGGEMWRTGHASDGMSTDKMKEGGEKEEEDVIVIHDVPADDAIWGGTKIYETQGLLPLTERSEATAAGVTAAAAAAVSTAQSSAARPARGKDRRRTTDEDGDKGQEGVHVEIGKAGEPFAGVVPLFCPAQPFERYAALHRDILKGDAEPRCGDPDDF